MGFQLLFKSVSSRNASISVPWRKDLTFGREDRLCGQYCLALACYSFKAIISEFIFKLVFLVLQ